MLNVRFLNSRLGLTRALPVQGPRGLDLRMLVNLNIGHVADIGVSTLLRLQETNSRNQKPITSEMNQANSYILFGFMANPGSLFGRDVTFP